MGPFLASVYNETLVRYSVMQSDGNSFAEFLSLDSFNQASWDEENILDQIYKA